MPAVLVHGVPDTPQVWDRVRANLSRTDVVTPALPGFGCPVPDGFDSSKEAYAGWLAGELEAIVEESGSAVDLVGHDWGSLLVQYVGSTRPDLVRTWAAGNGPVDEEYVWHDAAQLFQTAEVGEQVLAAMTAETMAPVLEEQGVPYEDALAAAGRIDDTMRSSILALYRSAVTVGAEWQPAVEQNQRPAMALWATDDPYVDARYGERLAARTDGRLVLLEGCGHWWPAQRPEEVAAILSSFWATAGEEL